MSHKNRPHSNSWNVLLGRRDSTTASLTKANSDLPAPTSGLGTLIRAFRKKGLSARDLTALSGAHAIGVAQCQNFRGHIYHDANVDPAFAAQLKANCSSSPGPTDSNLAPLDVQTRLNFDNAYYENLLARRGLLHSDQELFNSGSQDALVQQYSSNSTLFFADFVAAMFNMGRWRVRRAMILGRLAICPGSIPGLAPPLTPLTGTAGQIRLNCRAVNT